MILNVINSIGKYTSFLSNFNIVFPKKPCILELQ